MKKCSNTQKKTGKVPHQSPLYRAARAYLAAGLSFIPIAADGSKQPAIELLPRIVCADGQKRRKWNVFKHRKPTLTEVRRWFEGSGTEDEYGIAIIGGAVSGGLEMIDFDTADLFAPWAELVKKQAPGLLDKLVIVRTPRPGMHVYLRSEAGGGNQKLARVPDVAPKTGKLRPKTVIETKGEGGYCLAPPSPPACHPTGRRYVCLDGKDLTMIPTITAGEREILLDAARSFDRWRTHITQRRAMQRSKRAGKPGEKRPGDDFNQRADWAEVLEPHGWRLVGDDGNQVDYWCRPGKDSGVSATTNYEGSDLLYVFSANADPFDEDTAYDKFAAYALLEHEGDFEAAARDLAAKGYGTRTPRRRGRKLGRPFGSGTGWPKHSKGRFGQGRRPR